MFFKVCSFDIEVLTVESRMPSPDKDPILLVSCHFNYDYLAEDIKTRNIVLLLHRTKENIEKLENKIVYIFNNEVNLLKKLISILKENDVITGYNVVGFDLVYVIDRCKNLGIRNLNIGMSEKNIYYGKSLSKGFSVTKLGNSTGKIILDVLAVLRREDEANPLKKKYNLKNLKLEHVSREILGIEKLEFSIKEMNDYWNNCDDVELKNRFIDYCSRDSELALLFLTRFRLLDKFIAVSKASGKLLQDVINALGSGGFVENLLLKEFRKFDRVMPIRTTYGSHKDEEELIGAEVFNPKLGVTDNVGSADYKCCAKDTLILTDRGFIKIEDVEHVKMNALCLNTKAQSLDERDFQNKEIIDFKNIGTDKTKIIKLESGYELEGSVNHRIVVATSNSWGFKELRDLKVGDIVVLNKGSNIYGENVVFDYSSMQILDNVKRGRYGKERNIDVKKVCENLSSVMYLPGKVTVEFAEFFGYMVSDGWVGTENTNIGFTQKNDSVFIKFIELYDNVFKRKPVNQTLLSDWWNTESCKQEKDVLENFNNGSIDDVINKIKKNCSNSCEFDYRYKGGHEVRLSSVNLKRLFEYYGFSGNAYAKEVPWCILQSSKNVQCSFLKTLFEGDGCSCDSETNKSRRITYLSKSKNLCVQIQAMLLNMGIISNFYYIESSNDYRLEIHGYNCVLFYENVGFVSDKKVDRTKNIVNEVMGFDYVNSRYDIDYEKVEKKGKAGNKLYTELGLSEVLKRLHEKYMNSYNHLNLYKNDPSFLRRIYAYINGNENINILMLKKYLRLVEKVMRDDEDYILSTNDKDYLLLKWHVECNMVFLKVQKIEDGENELYDISVKDLQNYVSNGFISHNSLYPSILIKYNLCYSTLIREDDISKLGLTEADVEVMYDDIGNSIAKFVRKEKYRGIIPRKLEELLALRTFQKKEMKKYGKGTPEYLMYDSSQNGTKIMMNSFYGYTGDTDAKIYSWFIAASVTGNGRKQIKKTKRMIEEDFGKVKLAEREFILRIVMGDTDSSYINVISQDNGSVSRDETIRAVMTAINKVNDTLEKPMQLDFENYIRRIVIVAKKHYAMLTVDDNGKESITSKGIETVRRDWCNFSTETMSDVIDFVLKEQKVEDGITKSIELVKQKAKLLNSGNIDLNDLVLSNKLTKPITYYDSKEAHVMVAIKMKERGHPSEIGDRIQFIIIDNGKKLVSERAEEAELVIRNPDKYKIDKNYYLMYQLLPPIVGTPTRKGVLNLLGVTKEMMLSKLDDKQKSLFDY